MLERKKEGILRSLQENTVKFLLFFGRPHFVLCLSKSLHKRLWLASLHVYITTITTIFIVLIQVLPGNPLDVIISELGGSDKVAELTGRKSRLVRDAESGKVTLQRRNANGITLENQNLYEKDQFMKGKKLVAVISEAASVGISLQADRRVLNQKQRVHFTHAPKQPGGLSFKSCRMSRGVFLQKAFILLLLPIDSTAFNYRVVCFWWFGGILFKFETASFSFRVSLTGVRARVPFPHFQSRRRAAVCGGGEPTARVARSADAGRPTSHRGGPGAGAGGV